MYAKLNGMISKLFKIHTQNIFLFKQFRIFQNYIYVILYTNIYIIFVYKIKEAVQNSYANLFSMSQVGKESDNSQRCASFQKESEINTKLTFLFKIALPFIQGHTNFSIFTNSVKLIFSQIMTKQLLK